ncbi:AI-2E family transporter [Catenovulum sediminis]|uniref:AI-2E family transporter n=1 Tax=Catenovulum sediminis TaxID=1740262 RepID=A0ABV1RE34_9ALTE|nr:AI-2E family transporter [Catenovulum sediminis]
MARDLFLPLVAACLLSLLLSPAVRFLTNLGLPRFLSGLTMILVSAGLIVASVWVTIPALTQWMESAPDSISHILKHERELKDTIENIQETSQRVSDAVEEIIEQEPEANVLVKPEENWGESLLTSLQTGFGVGIIILTLTLFLLTHGDSLILNLIRVSAKRKTRRKFIKLFRRLRFEVGRYLAAVTLINALCGAVTSLIVWYFDLPMPWVWLVLVTFLRFVPYVGVAILAVLLTLISATQADTLWLTLAPTLCFLVMMNITGLLIDPLVHGMRLKINPIIVFVSVVFWGWLWGIAGAIIAVPMLTIILVSAQTLEWIRVSQIMTVKSK